MLGDVDSIARPVLNFFNWENMLENNIRSLMFLYRRKYCSLTIQMIFLRSPIFNTLSMLAPVYDTIISCILAQYVLHFLWTEKSTTLTVDKRIIWKLFNVFSTTRNIPVFQFLPYNIPNKLYCCSVFGIATLTSKIRSGVILVGE